MPCLLTPHVEHVTDVSGGWAISIARWKTELDAVIGQNDMDIVGHRFNQSDKEG